MYLTKKGDYCVRAMLDLATQDEGQLVLVKDIARRQEISERFLEQIMPILKNAGLVCSFRGARGGFSLARSPEEITLLDILQASVGDVSWSRCVNEPVDCSRSSTCAVREIWGEIGRANEKLLRAMTLKKIVDRQREKSAATVDTYEI